MEQHMFTILQKRPRKYVAKLFPPKMFKKLRGFFLKKKHFCFKIGKGMSVSDVFEIL